MANILVTGSKGQLGNEISVLANSGYFNADNMYFLDVDELDICNKSSIESFVTDNKIAVIINCAAYTAVDKAETEVEKAVLVNSAAPGYLAEVATKNSCLFIHVSTDYVFDGTNHLPYKETDLVNPQSVYGKTKLDGENSVLKFNKNAIIIRTSWLYSSFGNNFVKTIKRLASERNELRVIFDQIGTPTYARDLALAICKIKDFCISNNQSDYGGVYHFSDEGVCSWYDFASEIVRFYGLNCKVWPIETAEYPLPASRPAYSVLNKAKIKNTFNVEIPYWKDSLADCLQIINSSKK